MDAPSWLPDLHGELTGYAGRLGVGPREECSCIADESLVLTMNKRWDDPSLREPEPSEDFRRLSYRITRNLAVDHLRREDKQPDPFSTFETSGKGEGTPLDPAADSPEVGAEIEAMEEQFALTLKICKACRRVRRHTDSFDRRRLLWAVTKTYLELVASEDPSPSGREIGRVLIERGFRKSDGTPYSETTACEALYEVFEELGHDIE